MKIFKWEKAKEEEKEDKVNEELGLSDEEKSDQKKKMKKSKDAENGKASHW